MTKPFNAMPIVSVASTHSATRVIYFLRNSFRASLWLSYHSDVCLQCSHTTRHLPSIKRCSAYTITSLPHFGHFIPRKPLIRAKLCLLLSRCSHTWDYGRSIPEPYKGVRLYRRTCLRTLLIPFYIPGITFCAPICCNIAICCCSFAS